MAEQVKINRNKLKEIIEDDATVLQLELLIRLVNSLQIDGTETLEEIIERVHGTLP